jgi:hypothetical protein
MSPFESMFVKSKEADCYEDFQKVSDSDNETYVDLCNSAFTKICDAGDVDPVLLAKELRSTLTQVALGKGFNLQGEQISKFISTGFRQFIFNVLPNTKMENSIARGVIANMMGDETSPLFSFFSTLVS